MDVYSADEIAQAAGVSVARVEALVAGGQAHSLAVSPRYFAQDEAVAAVRALRADGGRSAALLFDKPEFTHASAKMPIAAASAVHAGIAATLILISTIGLPQAAETPMRVDPVSTRLVFIASPGPGGGGGGGGLRQKAPPPRAQRKGKSSLDSPVPVRKAPKPIEAAPTPEPPPPPPEVKPEPLPPVVAPVATVAANETERPGVIDEPAPKESESRGPGAGGGVGTGTGTGLGKGNGSGIGDGSGGGMGGGPYRPGSGVLPAANPARSESRLHRGRAASQRRGWSGARDCGAPRRFGRRRQIAERTPSRVERTGDCGRAAMAIRARDTIRSGGRRRGRGRG